MEEGGDGGDSRGFSGIRVGKVCMWSRICDTPFAYMMHMYTPSLENACTDEMKQEHPPLGAYTYISAHSLSNHLNVLSSPSKYPLVFSITSL